MKQIIVMLFFFAVVMFSCKPGDKIRGVNLTQTFPNITEKGKLTDYDTMSVQIYYHNNQELIRTPYYYTTESSTKTLYRFFLFNKGDKNGLMYTNNVGKEVSVDSILKKSWITNFDFYHLFKDSLVTLLSSSSPARDSLFEVYRIKGKIDTNQKGIISLNFSKKLRGLDFSLAKQLDSIKNMKLCKVNIINDARYIKEYNWHLDRVEQEWTLSEIPVVKRSGSILE